MDEFRFRRRNLPHWEIAGATYFVTFRLSGSLPAQVVEEWRRERERLRLELGTGREGPVEASWKNLARIHHAKFDAQLDRAGYGPKYLADPHVARLVVDALQFHQAQRYDLAAYVVMPNHVHVVLRPMAKPTSSLFWGLDEIMKSVKGYTGKEANKLLERRGEFWQREYYDHLIRDEEEWLWYVSYTHQNPVQAGLCARPEEWAWSSARARRATP